MTSALIGYTGFVGSNLLAAHAFDDVYNTSNINDLCGKHYDLLVTAGNRADSHRINNDGDADREEVDRLVDTIASASIDKLVLISTVCVYPEGGAPNEATPRSDAHLTPYGQNRLRQEHRLAGLFDTTIVRLPQLYGGNLKKGVVYDLLNDYRVEHIRPDAAFQHYDTRRLWDDIRTALTHNLSALNLATPAITNAELAAAVFDRDITGQIPPGSESQFARMYTRNMTTLHAELFGGSGNYLQSKDQVLEGLRAFVSAAKRKDY